MLIEFSAGNYLSLKDIVTFSMVASSYLLPDPEKDIPSTAAHLLGYELNKSI